MAEGAEVTGDSQPLFYAVSFTIIPSPTLTEEYSKTLIDTLTSNGATYSPLDPEMGRVDDIRHYSHIISTTADFPDYHAALDNFTHVVKPSWVETCIQKNKVSNPRQFSPDPCLFLSEVTVTCADIPEGDKEAIIGGVLAMGGQYSAPLTKMVTHIVALTLDNDKCEVALKKRLRCKMVLPHWFDDCLRLGKKISEGPYLLPDPDILAKERGPVAPTHSKDIHGATSPVPDQFPTPASSAHESRVLDVFKGRKIMLAADLNIGSRLQQTLETLTRNGGGDIVTDIQKATTYVCHYRDGPDYYAASVAGKDVGNLAWLYHLITHNVWTSPMRRLLHYPVPRESISGFKDFKISLSNYTGEARIYLENLVKAAGGEFTKTMKQDNTHLITAHTMSEKCDAAKEWNINIVNHLWLEESYAKCEVQSLTVPRYTHFPPRTNLSEVVGQVQIDRDAVEKHFFPKPPETLKNLEREMRKDEPIPRTNGVVQPTKPKRAAVPGSSGIPPQPRNVQSDMPQPSDDNTESYRPTPATTKAKRVRSEGTLRTPAASRFVNSNENETPSSTGSRGAKERAISKLHDLAPDMALYEKEKKRVGGVVHGRSRASSEPEHNSTAEPEEEKRPSKKRALDDEGDGAVEGRPQKAKKARSSKVPILHKMLLTKYEGWEGKPKKEAEEKNKLRNLGLHLTEDPFEATLLCAPKIVRTRKFVTAIGAAPKVVSTTFLEYCLENNKVPMEDLHALTDAETEEKYGFRLFEALERAKINKRRLLKGWQIFCTEGVPGGPDTMEEIVRANGGAFAVYKGRTGLTVGKRMIDPEDEASENRKEDEGDTLYLVSGCNPEEVALWERFRAMAKKAHMRPRIVRTDWLLSVAMAQYIHSDPRWELKEELVPAGGKG